LAESALREACQPLDAKRGHTLGRVPVYLGLPELRPGFTTEDVETVRAGVERFEGLPVRLGDARAYPTGHAAGLAAVAEAVKRLGEGKHEACLVGGVDSYFHPDTMEWLDANRQLIGTVSRSGFVPGEGAGFCLLMTPAACTRLGLKSPLRIRATAV